jgi:hypothetical protein
MEEDINIYDFDMNRIDVNTWVNLKRDPDYCIVKQEIKENLLFSAVWAGISTDLRNKFRIFETAIINLKAGVNEPMVSDVVKSDSPLKALILLYKLEEEYNNESENVFSQFENLSNEPAPCFFCGNPTNYHIYKIKEKEFRACPECEKEITI